MLPMIKTVKVISLLAVLCSLYSCAISKALYLGPNDYSERISSFTSAEAYNAENINGSFPEAVYIKTKTQSFNLYHYYILHEGRIWYKSIENSKEPKDWTLFMETGLPHNVSKEVYTNAVMEISADADELVALSAEGNFYRYCFDTTIAHRSNAWLNKQGWPVEEQIYFDSRTAKNRAWAIGKRNSHILYYEDIFGNQHHNGTMEIVTTYVLLEDGQEICYGDPGIPSDFTRNFIGPERGAFKAISLSASASTMFVINEVGEMYTRLVDFDTIGSDPMWYKYTYIFYESDLPGTKYLSNLNEWALPAEDWRPQPRIPLSGNAAITRHITILQNGHGNSARELRVAGLDEEGRTGYWYKPIFDSTWKFQAALLFLSEDSILVTAETYDPDITGERGPSLDKSYSGFWWNLSPRPQVARTAAPTALQYDSQQEYGWYYQIPNFNILEGDCDFLISWQGETCTLKLHPVEMWSYLKRDYLPGRTGSPKMFLVTLEVPENAFATLSDAFIRQLTEKFAQYDKTLFHYTIEATTSYIIMRETNKTSPLLFLTDGTISRYYSESDTDRYVGNFAEEQRYYSPELIVNENSFVTIEELNEKITLNRQFVAELKYKIRVLKWSQLIAFKFNAGYLPTHYIVKMTPLQFVDVPKIRTMTSFGQTVVLANSTYVYSTSNTRIQLYERIIGMLETRIRRYRDMEKELSRSSRNTATNR
jgi:hypothetical protein